MSTLPNPPPQLKAIQPYMKLALDVEKKQPAVAYWCRLYSVQTALTIDRKSPECVSFLTSVMDWMETFKKSHHDEETVTNETVGQAHVENLVINLFNKVDTMDRNGIADQSTIRMFYTSGLFFDVMAVFGPLTEEVIQKGKYAKHKAAYIQRCLKNGETPQPGPIESLDGSEGVASSKEDENLDKLTVNEPSKTGLNPPNKTYSTTDDSSGEDPNSTHSHVALPKPGPPPTSRSDVNNAPTLPTIGNQSVPVSNNNKSSSDPNHQASFSSLSTMLDSKLVATNGQPLKPEEIIKSQKYCKFAGSALQYDDVKTAVVNLEKALRILNTGSE